MPDDEDDFEDGEDEAERFGHLPSSAKIKTLLPQIVAAAQKVYDDWDQSDPDNDELNGGGICHLIADKTANILGHAHIPCATETASDVQHVYCVAQCSDGVFEVDIPYSLYERGSMFTWTKVPGVIFTAQDVVIYRLDGNPGAMGTYVSDWEDD